MLLLGRRVREEIVLPSCGVTITVVAIKGKTVRLGFSAPPDVRVARRELLAAAAHEGENDMRVLPNAGELGSTRQAVMCGTWRMLSGRRASESDQA